MKPADHLMSQACLLLVLAPLTGLLTGAAPANLPAPEKIPLAVKACYQKAQPDWDSGVTQRMIQGNGKYADCLEGLAVGLLKYQYPREILAGKDPKVFLDGLLHQIDTLSWSVENQVKGCAPMCGTMYTVTASARRADFLEDLLRRISERVLLESGKPELTESPAWKACWDTPEKCNLK